MPSTVILHSRVTLARALTVAAAGRAITATGRDIVETTKEYMTPGHFFWTGLSRDGETSGPAPDADKARAEAEADGQVGTVWEQITPLRGQVHVRTPWAAYAEFGTDRIAPRPALTPAIVRHWPTRLYEHARAALP